MFFYFYLNGRSFNLKKKIKVFCIRRENVTAPRKQAFFMVFFFIFINFFFFILIIQPQPKFESQHFTNVFFPQGKQEWNVLNEIIVWFSMFPFFLNFGI